MFKHFDWADAGHWVWVQHAAEQVHEVCIFIQAVTVIFLQSLAKVFQALLLLLKDLFALPTLYAKDPHAD